jgi:hypothetical protein
MEEADEPAEELSEPDVRRFADLLARPPSARVEPPAPIPYAPIPFPSGRFELTLLRPGDEERLALGRIRLDPAGYLSDRATGREIVPRGEVATRFLEFRVDRPRPHHYRIMTADRRTVFLRYSHGGWYHRVRS